MSTGDERSPVNRGPVRWYGASLPQVDAVHCRRQLDRRANELRWVRATATGAMSATVPVPPTLPRGAVARLARVRCPMTPWELGVRLLANPYELAHLEACRGPMDIAGVELARGVTPAGVRAVYATLAAAALPVPVYHWPADHEGDDRRLLELAA